ncbi:MAG: teicoplanin resistance protein VanZ [Actinobacteria bacterium HGW-Actinobacteria-1]|nr:MAG: teicoplanin resistance protein VanZ [Actinobacteria bacterium HGW-Actinobacteria-1]
MRGAPGMQAVRTWRIASWIAVAVWASVIFWFSSLTGSQVPGRYGSLGHFGEYAIFGALILLALETPARLLPAVALASAYGITDEVHQLFVSGRQADPVDWLVDTLGALVGAVVLGWLWRRILAGKADGRP